MFFFLLSHIISIEDLAIDPDTCEPGPRHDYTEVWECCKTARVSTFCKQLKQFCEDDSERTPEQESWELINFDSICKSGCKVNENYSWCPSGITYVLVGMIILIVTFLVTMLWYLLSLFCAPKSQAKKPKSKATHHHRQISPPSDENLSHEESTSDSSYIKEVKSS